MKKTFSVGIAGTAKNTGKTTTMNALLAEIKKEEGFVTAFTSIGYDGESFDNVTGLPKPRIRVWEGCLVAVAEKCLPYSDAEIEIISSTGIETPLGPVLIGRAAKGGKMTLAGPNKRQELRAVLNIFQQMGTDLVIVDGALNRIAPMSEADALILATGAARNTDIDRLAAETGQLVGMFNLPAGDRSGMNRVSSVLAQKSYETFLTAWAQGDVYVDGVFCEKFLSQLADSGTGVTSGKRLLFPDPMKVILSGEIGRVEDSLGKLARAGVTTRVAKTVQTLLVTINPFYPQYRMNLQRYEAAYVDKDALQKSIAAQLQIPCFNVMQQGGQGIWQALQNAMQ